MTSPETRLLFGGSVTIVDGTLHNSSQISERIIHRLDQREIPMWISTLLRTILYMRILEFPDPVLSTYFCPSNLLKSRSFTTLSARLK